MPAAHGKISDAQAEFIDRQLVDNGPFEDRAEAVTYLIRWSLDVKYGFSE